MLKRTVKLLDETVRDCFAYLGVMAPKPATFDLEAMKHIWRIDNPEVVVRELIDHGLLEHVGNGRYWMHAVLVAYARSMLR